MKRDELEQLSKDELIEAYLALQGKLTRPKKTSRTSSLPPSTDKKARRENSKPGGAKPGHKGHARKLCDTLTQVIDHKPSHCSGCGVGFEGSTDQGGGEIISTFEQVDIPPLTVTITHHRRWARSCIHCGSMSKAPLPDAATGSPFGPSIAALALYLKNFHFCSYQRLEQLFADVFDLKVSQGALMNLIQRSSEAFRYDYDCIVQRLRRAKSVASDETRMRIEGTNAQQWVFLSPDQQAIVHHADYTRKASVIDEVMGDHVPQFWTSDRYAGQQRRGLQHQTCLAHLARDVARVLEVGDERIGLRLKTWFSDVFALAHALPDLASSSITAKVRQLERRLDKILETHKPVNIRCEETRAVLRKISNARDQLLTFTQAPNLVEPTNNGCERALRPSVVARKVTNGFRAKWAADADCRVRTVVDSAKLTGNTPFQTISRVLNT